MWQRSSVLQERDLRRALRSRPRLLVELDEPRRLRREIDELVRERDVAFEQRDPGALGERSDAAVPQRRHRRGLQRCRASSEREQREHRVTRSTASRKHHCSQVLSECMLTVNKSR